MTARSDRLPPLVDRLPLLRRRGALLRGVRAFFAARGVEEVETPFLVAVPGEEVHLRPFRTVLESPTGETCVRWLHTSPEFAMKRIVAATGLPVFQLARVWRNGEDGPLHAPEFTMLEWYRPGFGMAALMDEVEALLRAVLPPLLPYREGALHLHPPFERLTVADAFHHHAGGVDVLATAGNAPALAAAAGVARRGEESWEDLFFRLLLERVEPAIGRERPCFLTHWPAEQAALARRDPGDGRVALRFELYAAGIELANGFDELTDPVEQSHRFDADRRRRLALDPTLDWPIDEALLAALPNLSPCSGVALGFDRLAMLATGARSIAQLSWDRGTA